MYPGDIARLESFSCSLQWTGDIETAEVIENGKSYATISVEVSLVEPFDVGVVVVLV